MGQWGQKVDLGKGVGFPMAQYALGVGCLNFLCWLYRKSLFLTTGHVALAFFPRGLKRMEGGHFTLLFISGASPFPGT